VALNIIRESSGHWLVPIEFGGQDVASAVQALPPSHQMHTTELPAVATQSAHVARM
jgi:hypothetical protein